MSDIGRDEGPTAVNVTALFHGVGVGTRHLGPGDGARSGPGRHYLVGSAVGVDAPADDRLLPAAAHALVTDTPAGFELCVTPTMSGTIVYDAGATLSLDAVVARLGRVFAVPPHATIRLACGAMTFVVRAGEAPPRVTEPRFRFKPDEHGWLLASVAALGLLLVAALLVPPDPEALSLDLLRRDPHHLPFQYIPSVEPPPPKTSGDGHSASGSPGQRHLGPEGAMGDRQAAARDRRTAIKGRADNPDPRIGKQEAIDAVRRAGVLGFLTPPQDSILAAVFTPDSTLGRDAESLLGHLTGAEIGSAYGLGGLGSHGTGAGGGGVNERTLGLGGLGTLGTFGSGSGGPGGSGRYGTGVGALALHHARTPSVRPGDVSARGALDKEIIRRIIRRHSNEIRYCYEQELARTPDLGGRVAVQFTIGGTGQVLTSVLQASTLASARVENCVVAAVRRWEFPKPLGGGLVMVSYPFVLSPAGS